MKSQASRIYYQLSNAFQCKKTQVVTIIFCFFFLRDTDVGFTMNICIHATDDFDGEEMPEIPAPEKEEDFTREEITEALSVLYAVELRILEL